MYCDCDRVCVCMCESRSLPLSDISTRRTALWAAAGMWQLVRWELVYPLCARPGTIPFICPRARLSTFSCPGIWAILQSEPELVNIHASSPVRLRMHNSSHSEAPRGCLPAAKTRRAGVGVATKYTLWAASVMQSGSEKTVQEDGRRKVSESART